MNLHQVRLLRRLFLPLFSRFNPGDVYITHHFTGEKIRLHSYRHKGYWYHGKQRESRAMKLFSKLITGGGVVIDVGGHIGYFALYFSHLVGSSGRVYVFEPGPNNLPYLRANTVAQTNITVMSVGVGSSHQTLPLYIESLTGQNNTFVRACPTLMSTKANAYDSLFTVGETTVEVVTLDEFTRAQRIHPSFIKIDVEGFELEVLLGSRSVLRDVNPMLMVEITANREEIFRLISEQDYVMFTPRLRIIRGAMENYRDVFCLHRIAHSEALSRLGLM